MLLLCKTIYLSLLQIIPVPNIYYILISICILVVLSYIFNVVSEKLRVPSVIMLISAGVGIQFLGNEFDVNIPNTPFLLELLGVVGLIFIVLEGALDLKLSRKKIPLIGKSFLSALFILIVTSAVIGAIFYYSLAMPLRTAIVYAVPLGIISSAIAIPSVSKLSPEKREFIIYETSFSDILGIMLFNYVIGSEIGSFSSFLELGVSFFLIVVVSLLSTFLLLLLLNYSRSHAKFYLIFASLILVYSVSKIFHLPSLLLILVFGVMLNNANLFIKGKLADYLHPEKLKLVTRELKIITAETAFIVRTFFFLIFGYTINLSLLKDKNVFVLGFVVMLTILVTRYVFLRFISRINVFPELFIAPRGLITIVLFYSIPQQWKSDLFNEGILLFVIILSTVTMMMALLFTKTKLNYDTEIL
ncbi:MAG: sodium:proton exchanger [Flavobacteriales bacterium]